MSRLFLDAGVFIGAASTPDPFHRASEELLERVVKGEWESAHTSDLVLVEALNYVVRKIRRREAAELILAMVFGDAETPPIVTSVLRIHGGRLAAAIDRLRSKFTKGLSLTDWATVVCMEEAGIDQLATFDRGFKGLVSIASVA